MKALKGYGRFAYLLSYLHLESNSLSIYHSETHCHRILQKEMKHDLMFRKFFKKSCGFQDK
jgi:hypothetical protein